MIFTSDNAAGAAPEILAAVVAASRGAAMPYGADPLTAEVEERLRALFEAPEARAFLVATGTAANALALACLCPPWGTIHAHADAHVERDECGAPAFFAGGAKIALIDGEHARMRPETLAARARLAPAEDVHVTQNAAVSITQATEMGAVYAPGQVREIAAVARAHGMGLHMDGTRFANAVARTGLAPAEMTWRAGVDILCLGATKNGAMAAEAVVIFDPARAREFELRRKRAGHLFSKMRFVAAQMNAWLADGLWLRLAARANAMADRLAAGIARAPGARVLNAVEANMVFAEMSLGAHRRLAAAGARYYPAPSVQDETGPDRARFGVRLVCSHDTTEAEVDRFVEILGNA